MSSPENVTASPADRQTHGFQAEVRELLKLMIHSLYSHREIFLRELISNASDANDRLRFAAIGEPALLASDPELEIRVEADQAAGTVSITDNGIGMTREEAVANLGTIARSGTAEFFRGLSGDQQKDSQLIGQFGVGFYSAFIVADRVEVLSRRAGLSAESGVHWESSADGEFYCGDRDPPAARHDGQAPLEARGQGIRRSLPSAGADPPLLRPHRLPGAHAQGRRGVAGAEAVNQAKALWTRPRTEISDEEYRQFYQHLAHDFTDPLAWSHNRVEGKREYTSLLYLPGRAPFDLWQRDAAHGLKLYVRRVFIMDDAEQFLPLYLRFVKGVVDSSDLPLNVSRELLQQEPEVEAIRGSLTKRVLDMLAKLAKEEPEKYATFWKEFGAVLKEGVAQDAVNRPALLQLLRFASTHESGNEPTVSLAQYVERMKPGQDQIYYIIAESVAAARASPYIERLTQRGLEVLLLSERIDEWVMGQLPGEIEGFPGRRFKDAARGDLELGTLESEADRKRLDEERKESKGLLKRVKDAIGDRIARGAGQRPPRRLTGMSGSRRARSRRRHAADSRGRRPGGPESKPVLELNVGHPLVKHLDGLADTVRFKELSLLLYEQAELAEGSQLGNPAEFVQRLNRLLVELTAAHPGS